MEPKSMLGLLRKQKPYEQEAKKLYASALLATRSPQFYKDFAIQDTMEARFDLLCLHLSIIIKHTLKTNHPDAQDLNQTLFDTLFIDMEQTLREMGIGDTGIPKRIKKMMTGFNGRLHTYHAAQSTEELTKAIERNIYSSPCHEAKKLAAYVQKQQSRLDKISFEDILNANTLFTE